MPRASSARVRFGGFELNLVSGELRNGNTKVVLQQQPLQILRMLIESDGELLPREEIKKKLWPNDTVVEFDRSINAAIKNLRRTLGDSADEPKYIETFPRRGYRLMVPVEWFGADDSSAEASGGAGGTAVQLQRQPGLIGERVSHYRVLEVIGGGGMGMVYKAEDLKLGRQVALKFLSPELASDPGALQRFEREARAASSLDHPNICTIYEVEEYEGQPFIVMQLLQGETLRDRLAALAAKQETLPLQELMNVAIQICNGLQVAHAKGIIHRDIKPANIFLTSGGQVKILDFGLVKLVSTAEEKQANGVSVEVTDVALVPFPADTASAPDATLTRFGVAMGTAGYMSPEQVRGEELDARTDIFSFGSTLYEMATGQRAFSGETAALVHNAILNDVPAPMQELNAAFPPHLVAIINKALEKDREQRYQSATALRAALTAVSVQGREERASWRSGRWLAAAGAVVITAAAGLYWRVHTTGQLNAGDALVVADVENRTGDPAFNDSLKPALETELAQTPFLDILGPDKVRAALRLTNRSENERLTPALAKEVCAQTNSTAVVTVSIGDEGNKYRIELKAVDCNGKALASAVDIARNRNLVVKTLGYAGVELRRKLGEPAVSIRQYNKPLDEATSSSLEALEALSQGDRARMVSGWIDAIPLYKKAVDLDPDCAIAWTHLGIMYGNLHNDTLQTEYLTHALELRERLTQRDRFAVEVSYYYRTEGNLEKAIPIYQEWLQSYPRDRTALISLGDIWHKMGQDTNSVALYKDAIRIDPNELVVYENLIEAEIKLDHLDEALAVYDQARSQKIDFSNLAYERYRIAFLQDDGHTMQQMEQANISDIRYRAILLSDRARVEEYYGRFRRARALWARAQDSSNHRDAIWAAEGLTIHALAEGCAGNSTVTLDLAKQALARNPARSERGRASLAIALAGDANQAETLARAIERDYPVDTLVQDFWLPVARAAIELNRNHPANAIQELDRASRFEEFGYMLPSYLRGQAYLKLGQPQKAATEFQSVLDHRTWRNKWDYGSISHLQIARAQAMMGDKTAARNSYQRFLALWKDADPDIPIYKQAKAEYAKLR